MIRAISIVLIVTIALQSFGCSTWRPLARLNDVPENAKQTLIQGQFPGKLKEGMRVRIRIREGRRVSTTGEVIDGIIKRVGQTSFTVIPMTFYAPSNVSRELTLHYSDIESIEFRESKGGLHAFFAGVGVGAVLGLLLVAWALSGITLD